MDFRLRQMEIFRSVMLTGSINGAAKLLFISQPAVSRIIAHTEQTLGLKLFNRAKGKLIPTPEGVALFRQVDEFYEHALQVNNFARDLAQGATGTLNLSSSPCLSYTVMPRAIAQFIARYPKIRVVYHTSQLNCMATEVLSNKVDVAVAVMPIQHPNVKVEVFTTGKMACVLPKDHPLGSQTVLSLADVSAYPLIVHHPSITFGKLVSTAFRDAGLEMRSRVNVFQTDVACSLVRAGAGIAIVDEYTACAGAWHDLMQRPLAEPITLTPCIVRSAFDNQATHADKFIEILRGVAHAR
ncbi:bacterial regulatory helix-turn-helix, lysR family protein [Paraburkholderia xenovorans LB400]|jgi:DNA-binding transcriptional LysR family regulator|uniref:Transcriptional regulator, LysR family n=1 Tax=Paraburkholderia xenovorans (strain LB400) TaxID=266265 RepID=Q13PZ5_PARXL|nr:LysR family transcriptional regulator [Paraburkholderia xenovorans]ABE33844.1 transcriptional regulator, LysR family [Paraburkholderia xenovorans LB400]AIP35916.1 bacterial regulatory helix-turn-helix, lysR family protein [Paraburkholderia xenovorans LB400]